VVDVHVSSVDRSVEDGHRPTQVLGRILVGGIVSLELIQLGQHVRPGEPIDLDPHPPARLTDQRRVGVLAVWRRRHIAERPDDLALAEVCRAAEQLVVALPTAKRAIDRNEDPGVGGHSLSIVRDSSSGHEPATVPSHTQHKEVTLSKLLVHLVTGPENPTRGALAFLVAKSAAAAGHDATMFLAGDAVGYLRNATMDAAVGIGTGSIREHYTAISAAGVPVFASGMSSKARGLDAAALGDKVVELVPPERLVELITQADSVVTY